MFPETGPNGMAGPGFRTKKMTPKGHFCDENM